MDCSVIIVNYRQKALTEKCIASVRAAIKSVECEIIVVNNSPDTDSFAQDGVKIIESPNKGYGSANNLGAAAASGKYLFFLNPDTLVGNDFLPGILKLFEDGRTGIAGCRLIYPGGGFQVSFGSDVSFFGEIKNRKTEKLYSDGNFSALEELGRKYSEVTTVDWVSGAAFVIPKYIFDEIGGFDEEYFLYYEDSDLCRRVRNAGYEVKYYPFSEIVHYKGENTAQNFYDGIYAQAKKSQLLYYKKHLGLAERIFLRIYLVTKYLILSLSFRKTYINLLGIALGKK